jgi:DNA polymerase-1
VRLLVDGSNVIMRCAFGGELEPEKSTPNALSMIRRACEFVKASHLIVAMDYPDSPSWRLEKFSGYKANRTTSTAPWLIAGIEAMHPLGWTMTAQPGFEADDVLATIVARFPKPDTLAILSNDTDLLPLTTFGVWIIRPADGSFEVVKGTDVPTMYDLPSAASLVDYKAMVGDSSDNIPGVPGIGAKRAAKLLNQFDTLEGVIGAGEGGYSKDAETVYKHRFEARLARELITLRTDVPLLPIDPNRCRLNVPASPSDV